MGDNFEAQMTIYFEDLKKFMKQRLRIPFFLVGQHITNIFFLVDIDYTYIQAALSRVRWLRPLGYDLDVDEASVAIIALRVEEIDKASKPFGTYDVVKSKVEMELKTTSIVKRKDKLVRKIKKKFGADIERETGVAEEEEEEENDSEEEEEQGQGPMELTQSLGEDKEEGVKEEEADEAPKNAESKKRKAKTQPPAQPRPKKSSKPAQAKPKSPSTRATTRESTQKAK